MPRVAKSPEDVRKARRAKKLRDVREARAVRVGASLRGLRLARGFSIRDLYAVSGVAPSVIHRIENGTQHLTSIHPLWALADALEVTLDDLVGREPPRRSPPA